VERNQQREMKKRLPQKKLLQSDMFQIFLKMLKSISGLVSALANKSSIDSKNL